MTTAVALLERDELLARLADARGGGGRLVFVGGEAGVGKTALVRHRVRGNPRSTDDVAGSGHRDVTTLPRV